MNDAVRSLPFRRIILKARSLGAAIIVALYAAGHPVIGQAVDIPITQAGFAGHLGFGAVPCRRFNDGVGTMATGEMRQWAFGYLSGIDPDLFRLSESTSPSTEQNRIFETVQSHLTDHCKSFPNHFVGDGMLVLRATVENDRWQDYLTGE